MPEEKIPRRYVWNAAEELIRIRPPTEEQMPDDDTLAPAPGHSEEAARHGGSRIDRDSKIRDTRYSEGVMVYIVASVHVR